MNQTTAPSAGATDSPRHFSGRVRSWEVSFLGLFAGGGNDPKVGRIRAATTRKAAPMTQPMPAQDEPRSDQLRKWRPAAIDAIIEGAVEHSFGGGERR